MNKIVLSMCLLFSLTVVCTSYAAELTKNTVTEMLAEADAAVNERDVSAIAGRMSDDVSITMNLSHQGQSHTMSPYKVRVYCFAEGRVCAV